LGSNTDNTCVASICSLITDAYSIYHYLNDYENTNNDLDIAYTMTYLVEAFNSGFNVDCTAASFSTPLKWKQSVMTDNNSITVTDDSITDIFTNLSSILGSLQEVVGLLEVLIDSQTVYAEWVDA
jgi:hypothetical protein